jgi:Tfp pilus assembly protein PilO
MHARSVRVILLILTVVVAAWGYWWVQVRAPLEEQRQSLVAEEERLRQVNESSRSTIRDLGPELLRERITKFEAQLGYVSALLPIDSTAPDLLGMVAEATAAHNVELTKGTPEPPTGTMTELGLPARGLRVTMRGGYHDIAAVATRLLSQPRITHLRALEMKALGRRDILTPLGSIERMQVEGTFTILALSRPMARVAPTADSAAVRPPAPRARPTIAEDEE